MLLSFSVENWMSFRDRVSFSMIASRESQHGERLPVLRKYKTKILPIAAIYGGNASGKTNFFKALHFAKKLIVKGRLPDSLIPVEPFRLDKAMFEQPSYFSFELLVDEIIYEFSFSVTRKHVVEEKLVQVKSTTEKVLYHRLGEKIDFDPVVKKDASLGYVSKGTRDNQLFLTNSVSQKIEKFEKIHNWFKDTLTLVAPDSRFGAFEQFLDKEHYLSNAMNDILPRLNTGIASLEGEEISFENILLPETFKHKLQEDLQEGMSAKLIDIKNDRVVVTRKNGELTAKRLVTYHLKPDGEKIKFEMEQESDGTQRIIDLLPAFLELSIAHTKKVYVIDEIDRSLHTLLTRRMIEEYLLNCSADSRAQLLMTTHDVLLMDQHLLRRDEMWVTERSDLGVSSLFSFSEYKDIRYDKDIRKSYLQGRLGGIPRIFVGALFSGCREASQGERQSAL